MSQKRGNCGRKRGMHGSKMGKFGQKKRPNVLKRGTNGQNEG